jgi:hypothetical protein
MALKSVIEPLDFSDILDQVTESDLPDEPMFSVRVESGYGTVMRVWTSEPFPLSSYKPLTGEYDGWSE